MPVYSFQLAYADTEIDENCDNLFWILHLINRNK